MAKKIRLDVDRLAVQSYETGAGGGRAGTVRGNAAACTNGNSCFCDTSPFACGTQPYTQHVQSCARTSLC